MKSKILIKWNWVGNKKWNGEKCVKGVFLSYNYWRNQNTRFIQTKAEKLIFAHFLCRWDPGVGSLTGVPINKTVKKNSHFLSHI